jgi:hypothetical protein
LADFGRTRIIDDGALENQTKPSAAVERDNKIGEAGDSIRWTAPEMMDPDRFGFSKNLVAKIPSKETDIYALGMTILEVSDHLVTTLALIISCRSAGTHRASPIWPKLGRKRREEGNRWGSSGEA